MVDKNICEICNKNKKLESLSFMTQKLCKTCYSRIIEKRIRKNIRTKKLINPHEKICIIDDGSINSKIIIYMMKIMKEKMPIEISILRLKKKNESLSWVEKLKFMKYDRILYPINSDNYSENFLNSFFGKNYKPIKKNTKEVFILDNISGKECFYFAKFKGLISDDAKMPTYSLDRFDEPYPETKHSFRKSIELFEKIVRK